jgi:cbb3-type cytochrome oxidase maturation protein
VNPIGLILLSLGLGLVAWLGFYWSVKSGQYDDPEGPKYRMLDDDDAPSSPERPDARPPGEPRGRPPGDPPRGPPPNQAG